MRPGQWPLTTSARHRGPWWWTTTSMRCRRWTNGTSALEPWNVGGPRKYTFRVGQSTRVRRRRDVSAVTNAPHHWGRGDHDEPPGDLRLIHNNGHRQQKRLMTATLVDRSIHNRTDPHDLTTCVPTIHYATAFRSIDMLVKSECSLNSTIHYKHNITFEQNYGDPLL